jgi:Tfp pilus assembly protein FimT
MIKVKKQTGFAALESLLILAIIAVIGGIGWYAYNSKSKTDKILSQADKISQSTPVNSDTASTQKYVVIKEWNVKIKTNDADKISSDPSSCGNPDCSTELVFKSSITADRTCSLIMDVIQQNEGNHSFTPSKSIGKSSYALSKTFNTETEKAFSNCSSNINTLRDSIRNSISVQDIVPL